MNIMSDVYSKILVATRTQNILRSPKCAQLGIQIGSDADHYPDLY